MSPIPLRHVQQPGLEWDATLSPEWTIEPPADIIKKIVVQHLELNEEPNISFFAEGALNKLYAFDCSKGRYLMRVALPAAPSAKTNSEVATIAFIRKTTEIPVPQIITHDSTLPNELGFEWIIMERIDALPLRQVWHKMSWLKKQLVVQQVAKYWVELFNIRLVGIGSIHTRTSQSTHHGGPDQSFKIGEIVLPDFFIGDHIQLDIDRGPYNSSRNYLNACLDMLLHDATKLLASDDEDLNEHGQTIQDVYEGLKSILPHYFPHSPHRERTLIYHRDISTSNILVNEDTDLISIVDWECVAAVPIWQACELPQFLQGDVREFADVPNLPADDADADTIQHYQENVESYEMARLRTFFLEEMQRLSPEWVTVFHEARLHHDILLAIHLCYDDSAANWIKAWLKAVIEGPEPTVNLTDGLRAFEHRRNADWFQAWMKTRNL